MHCSKGHNHPDKRSRRLLSPTHEHGNGSCRHWMNPRPRGHTATNPTYCLPRSRSAIQVRGPLPWLRWFDLRSEKQPAPKFRKDTVRERRRGKGRNRQYSFIREIAWVGRFPSGPLVDGTGRGGVSTRGLAITDDRICFSPCRKGAAVVSTLFTLLHEGTAFKGR